MRSTISWFLFVGLLLFAAAFIVHTGSLMPEQVALQFGVSGEAYGFMSRNGYIVLMLIVAVGFPLGLVGVLVARYRRATSFIDWPNKDYWLAPEHREKTIAFLITHAVWFGSLLVTFLCFIHWLVVGANAVQPPRLPTFAIIGGVIVFLACLTVWVGVLFLFFRHDS